MIVLVATVGVVLAGGNGNNGNGNGVLVIDDG
jgi:hypothetical protein